MSKSKRETEAERAAVRGGDPSNALGVTVRYPDGSLAYSSMPRAQPDLTGTSDGEDDVLVEDAGVSTGELYDPDWRLPDPTPGTDPAG